MLLDFNHDGWLQSLTSRELRIEASVKMVPAMVDAWFRLSFYFEQPRFQVFGCTHDHHCVRSFNRQRMSDMVAEFQGMAAQCDQCLGSFVAEMLPRMQAAPEEAFELLSDVVVATKVTSTVVERAHLIGEEFKPPRGRGRAMKPASLSARAFQGFAVLRARRKCHGVLLRHFKRRGLSRMSFSNIRQGIKLFGSRIKKTRAPIQDFVLLGSMDHSTSSDIWNNPSNA